LLASKLPSYTEPESQFAFRKHSFDFRQTRSKLRAVVQRLSQFLIISLINISTFGLRFDCQTQNPKRLLEEADRLAWLNNWIQAGPLYERAEILFSQDADTKNALYARIGSIQASFQSRSLPDLSRDLAAQMQNPIIQNDAHLKLRWLVAKAEVDIEIDPPAAQRAWEEIRSLAGQLGDKAWEARAQGKLGYIAFFQGDIYRTQELMREAFYSAESLGDVGAQIWYATTIGNGLGELGLHDQAIKFLDEALRLAAKSPDAGFPYIGYAGKARSLGELKKGSEARTMLEKGLKVVRSLKRRLDEAYYLILLAKLSASENNLPLAASYLEVTRNLCLNGGFHHTMAWSMFELAKVYRDNGNLQKAEDRANLAMNAMRQVQDRYHLPQHLALIAELVAKRGRFREADKLLEQAADVTEAMLANAPSTFSKSSLIATMSAIYVGHFTLAVEYLKDKPRAFEILERARGRAVADAIRNHSSAAPKSDEETQALEREINQIQTRLQFTTFSDRTQTDALLDQLWRAKERLNSIPQPRTRFQELTIRSSPVSVEHLSNILDPDEVVLEYLLSEPASYCLIITTQNFDIVPLAGRKKLESQIGDHLTDIRSAKPTIQRAKQLYSMLLRPVLRSPDQFRHLTIVADGKLHLLPFESLVDSKGQFVLQSHTVSVAPSATVYYLLSTAQTADRGQLPFLGLGGVPYGREISHGQQVFPQAASTSGGAWNYALSGLKPLPGAADEVESIAGIMGNRSITLIGPRATKAAFLSQRLPAFRILHFAVHALSDATFPDRSSLVLGRDPNSGMDGLLQERDIRHLNLNAELVVLSACDTNLGRLQEQEGMVNLVRAFFYAGARTVVASLWKVGDDSTANLMKRFYGYLARGDGKGSALRRAKLDIIRQYGKDASPYFWAGFTLHGDSGSSAQDEAR
jgi:CHAT domain-containing protein